MYPLTHRKGTHNSGGKGREKLRYVNGSSFIHGLDPRTKLFMLLAISFGALMAVDILPALLVFAVLLALASLSGNLRHWLNMLAKISPMFLLIAVFDSFFSHVSWGPVWFGADVWVFHPVLTPGSILYGVSMGFRFAAVTGSAFLFIMTTKFEDLVAGLRKLGVPYIIAFSLGLALRSVTYLSADMKAVVDAQRSRGMELDAGLLRYDRLLPLLMPMIISLIGRSRNISSAMMCRGYGYTEHPTLYSKIRMKPADWTAIVLISAAGLLYFLVAEGVIK